MTTKNFLTKLFDKYDSEVLEWPEKYVNKSSVKFKCANKDCDIEVTKQIRNILASGPVCRNCSNYIQDMSSNDIEDNIKKKESDIYTLQNIFKVLKRDNASLMELPEKINRDTKINYRCGCSKNNNINTKKFRSFMQTGGYCTDCTNERSNIKRVKTNNQKYGVDHTYALNNVKQED